VNTEAEQLAWIGLARAIGPGDRAVEARVLREGPLPVWTDLRGDHPDVDPRRDLDATADSPTSVICRGDEEWPIGLADLGRLAGADREDAGEPFALWVRGTASLTQLCEHAVAIVGARDASDYGMHVASDLACSLADLDWTIVSGAAFGIDGAAHRGALAVGGMTVAVVAGGVDVPYPRAHTGLLDRIASEGLIVSESPPGAAPYRHRFLTRNRIIAALSSGTVLVEAGLRSGALNTTRHARRLGRALMVVPGPVTSRTSAGCHHLLRIHREEAAVVTRAADVIEEVGPIGALADLLTVPPGPRDGLPELARRILDAVPARAAVGPAVIAREVRQRPETVLAILGPLAAEGLVERGPDGYRLTALGRAPSAAGAASRSTFEEPP
jgi:DNA processing protein